MSEDGSVEPNRRVESSRVGKAAKSDAKQGRETKDAKDGNERPQKAI